MRLTDLSNIPFRLSVLESIFPDIAELSWKAKRLERNGDIVRLKRGLFVVEEKISGKTINDFLLANHIYGPSYVSMETALRFYGLIPENVYTTKSITTGTSKLFTNSLGTFQYIHCPDAYFSIGIISSTDGSANYLIATPEKALCDLINFTPKLNLRYASEVKRWLEDDVRFDMDEIARFDISILKACATHGKKKTMIEQIINIITNSQYE